tara:strand:- start:1254 stop:1724 length:471 start_codon:yes stop_codon:yes gene_type:complete
MLCCFNWKNKNADIAEQEELYKDATWGNCPPFHPSVKYGKVIKVYDGDTITLAAKPYENHPIYRFSVRLNGIDTPEIKTKVENEKKHALIARDALSERILNKIVRLENVESEKYGRLLADVYLDNDNLNEWMIEKNYAVKYAGDTKVKPKEWFEDI